MSKRFLMLVGLVPALKGTAIMSDKDDLEALDFYDPITSHEELARRIECDESAVKSLAQWPIERLESCLLYTSPSPRDQRGSRMPSSA